MKNRKLLLKVLLLTVITVISNVAVSSPYTNFGVEGWTEIGPDNLSGRARAAIFDKFNDGVLYVGTVGGLYVSVNYGKNWHEINLNGTTQNVTALAQDDNGLLYVATGEGYYNTTLHRENPIGHSNNASGTIGSGIFSQNSENFDKNWATNLADSDDATKYAYVDSTFKFTVISSTVPEKYDISDEWAFINAMVYVNNTLYVGTKNGGLKYKTADSQSFSSISAVSGNVYDIKVNNNGVVAVASDEGVFLLNGNTATLIFDESSLGDNFSYAIANMRLAFAERNPNDLYILVASAYSTTEATATGMNAFLVGIFRPTDKQNGINSVSTESSSWFNIASSSLSLGYTLANGMAITVDDRDTSSLQTIYIGGEDVLAGQDVNGEGIYSFSQMSSYLSTDTLNYYVGTGVNNILLMPNAKNAYDSMYLFVTSNSGAYRYYYDSVIRVLQWFPATKGMNTLQAYHVAASSDGSVVAAAQSNAIVYMPSYYDTALKSGAKVWSVNNPNYPTSSNSTYYTEYSQSGSNVLASAAYRTTPQIRKPYVFARPGTNITRTYTNQGSLEAIDDQTWTYGYGSAQTLMPNILVNNVSYDQFNTPMALWEDFNFNNAKDSVTLTINSYTTIHRNGRSLSARDGQEILVGDSVLVQGGSLSYPFIHVFKASDVNGLDTSNTQCYQIGANDTVFVKLEDLRMQVPNKTQSRVVLATTTGAYVCARIFDFSRSNNPQPSATDLTWARIYTTGTPVTTSMGSTSVDYTTLNNRIHAIDFSSDGSSVFIAVDVYSDYTTYQNTNLIRVSGLNDVDLTNAITFRGISEEPTNFQVDTIQTFNRQISSIECSPANVNDIILTFEGYSNSEANVKISHNAMATDVTFTDRSLGSDDRKPVFCALFGTVGSSNGNVYVGSDDGIYKLNGNSWVKEENVPTVPVYDLWQQTANLPQWNFLSYTGENSEAIQFNAPVNRGVIYAATYGKGLLVNSSDLDTTHQTISLQDAEYTKPVEVLALYPNPASSQTTISYSLDTPSNVILRMFDLNGRVISQLDTPRQSKGVHTQVIDVQNLQKGVYVIQILTQDSVKTAKLIVK